jgi:hypothetical protein
MKIRNQGHFPDADPVDPDQLARDDALLDALAAGTPGPADDDLATMLSAWQSSVSSPALSSPASDVAISVPARPVRSPRPLAKLVAALAGAVVVLGGGLTAAAAGAGPDSPLWPITRIVYADRADSRAASQTATELLDKATKAFAEHRYADSAALTDQASAYLPKVTDAAARQRLEARIQQLRAALATVSLPVPGSSPTPSGTVAPGAAAPTPAPSGKQAESTPAPSTSPSPSQGGLLPLPPLLPSVLPSLPLLSG